MTRELSSGTPSKYTVGPAQVGLSGYFSVELWRYVGWYHAPLPIPATMDWGNRRSQWNGGTGSRGRLH